MQTMNKQALIEHCRAMLNMLDDPRAVGNESAKWNAELFRAALTALTAEPDGWITDEEKWEREGIAAAYKTTWRDSPNQSDIPFYFTPPVASQPDRAKLRQLVDLVWNEATESTAVPSTAWADELIEKAFGSATAARPAPVIGWRKVSDGMPPDEHTVIVKNAAGVQWIADVSDGIFYPDEFPRDRLCPGIEITHWMPFPDTELQPAVSRVPDGWETILDTIVPQPTGHPGTDFWLGEVNMLSRFREAVLTAAPSPTSAEGE